jgi:hypothetical protein
MCAVEHDRSIVEYAFQLALAFLPQLLLPCAFGFILLLLSIPLFLSALLLVLTLLLLSLEPALAFFQFLVGLLNCCGVAGGDWSDCLPCWGCCMVHRAVIVGAYGESRAYASAVDDDCRFGRFARWRWLRIRVVDEISDLQIVASLNGSGPLLKFAPPAVLDLDECGGSGNRAVDMRG